ncbi:MAG TPA: hypothetical protein VNK73_00430 [Actinomycetota bacterium]|nr:hypothetical protein [Actinomycetota bacterium]
MSTRRSLAAPLVGVLLLAAGLAGCAADKTAGASPTSDTLGPRPSSPAKLAIVSPRNGATVPAAGAPLRVSLSKAKIVNLTSRNIKPDEGHIHVLVDERLVAMNYQLKGELPKLDAGTHVVKVEFVAADHLPFDPRVLAQAAFVVK